MPLASGRALLRALAAALVLGVSPGVAQAPSGALDARDLATLVDLDGLSVSPDGRLAAFLTRQANPQANVYAQAWHVVPTRGGRPRQIGDGGEPIQPVYLGRTNGFIRNPAPVWSPDSQWIAYLRKESGRTQVWRARVDGQRSEQLTRGEGDAREVVFSADGRRVLYETDPSAVQIAAALAEEGRAGFRYDRRFFPSWSTTPVLPADVSFVPGSRSDVQETQRRVQVVELASRRDRAATEAEAAEFAALASAPAPDGREHYRENAARSPGGALAWTEARDATQRGRMALLTIVAQSGAGDAIVCVAEQCTSQRFKGLWRRNDDEVLFARGEGIQDTALYAWRVGDAAPRLILRAPDLFAPPAAFDWRCATALNRLVCFYEEPARPRRLVAIDLNTGAVETLFEPNPAFARLDLGVAPQRIEFRAPSGIENFGYLILPPERREGERLSLVIVTYRCNGFLRGGVGDEYPMFPFAAAGHAVLCFNTPDMDYARLATMDVAAYTDWMRGPGDPEKHRVQEGLETAISELDRLGVIDPARVGVTGLSFGGETTTYALWNMPSLAAAIASGTELGPSSTFLSGPSARSAMARWGLDHWNSPRWNSLSITHNAERVRAPLLLNVSDHEMIGSVHPVTALEQAGRSVEMFVFPNEYHIKSHPAHRLAIYNRNIDWMNFWLRGVEAPDPAKAEQYRRWRAMRENQCRLFTGPDAPWYCRR
jgi:dipeptidyl aminopeptidase/acylaminoacyl peptidase